MSKHDKLLAKIVARPIEADYDDVEKLLFAFGWRKQSSKGSHNIFGKAGEMPIIVPTKHGKTVKRHYLNDICSRLGLDDLVD